MLKSLWSSIKFHFRRDQTGGVGVRQRVSYNLLQMCRAPSWFGNCSLPRFRRVSRYYWIQMAGLTKQATCWVYMNPLMLISANITKPLSHFETALRIYLALKVDSRVKVCNTINTSSSSLNFRVAVIFRSIDYWNWDCCLRLRWW